MSGHYVYPARRRTAIAVGLNAALVGTGLNVLYFNPATIVGTNMGVSIVNSAADGTTVTFTRRGLWRVELTVAGEADGDFAAGISLAAPPTALQEADNPLPATAAFAGSLLRGAFVTTDAGVAAPLVLDALVPISQEDILLDQNVLRFHANDNAGGGLADADVTQTQCMYRIVWVADLKGA